MTGMRSATAVARFLGVEAAEVRKLVVEGDLPGKWMPGKKRDRLRFFLPDVWAWVCARRGETGQRLGSYEEFRKEFEAAQQGKEAV